MSCNLRFRICASFICITWSTAILDSTGPEVLGVDNDDTVHIVQGQGNHESPMQIAVGFQGHRDQSSWIQNPQSYVVVDHPTSQRCTFDYYTSNSQTFDHVEDRVKAPGLH
jgi:hypothetical protein